MEAVSARVTKTVTDQLGVDQEKVTPQARLTDDLGADSLDVVELVMALEDEFGIAIADEEAEKIETVQDIIEYIEALKR